MKQPHEFGFGTQIRKSPYFEATVRWGAKGFSVYRESITFCGRLTWRG